MKRSLVFLYVLLVVSYYAVAQNVGIGTTNPAAKLHTVGSVKFDTLSGIGIRPVFVDASGKLLATIPESTFPVTSITNSTSQSIPDDNCAGVTSNIVLSGLPGSVLSANIKATVNITHTYVGDLKIYLVAPNGNVLNLWNGDGGSSDDLVNTIFTDAGVPISTGISPYTASFTSAGNLTPVCSIIPTVTSFGAIGAGAINPNGTWALKIFDQAGTDIGDLNNWTLTVDPTSTGKDGVWGLKGNAGNNNFNFIGTTDNVPLNFRVYNQKAGGLDYNLRNIFLGVGSGNSVSFGNFNIGIGDSALYFNTTGSFNTAVGTGALVSNTVSLNTAIGYRALYSNTTGWYNTATGFGALENNVGAWWNTAHGFSTLSKNTTGDHNAAFGAFALSANTTGRYNTACGSESLSSNTTGYENVAVGFDALIYNTIGKGNTASGYGTLTDNVSGNNNTASGSDALHRNVTGNSNTATGDSALFLNNSGSYNTAMGRGALQSNTVNYNTGIGSFALQKNTTGTQNTGVGDYALNLNTTGSGNIGIGSSTLTRNLTGGSNIAIGVFTMLENTTGNTNTAIGGVAMQSNKTGNDNTVTGFGAMWSNVGGSFNTATGQSSLYKALGNGNTGTGDSALYSLVSGNNNTSIGYRSGFNSTGGSNNIMIGYNAQVPSLTGSNQVRIGDDNITYAGVKIAWTITSDSRYKSQIQNSNLGLNFIKQLRPVSYFRKNDKSEKLEFGFIAQEVEHVLQQSGSVNTGIISKDDGGMYSLRYNDLMAPMVKAIQEQQAMIEELRKEVEYLKKMIRKK